MPAVSAKMMERANVTLTGSSPGIEFDASYDVHANRVNCVAK
jgi:hypothetical protein